MKFRKVYYIIVYEDGKPFLSIPTYDKNINQNKIIEDYGLNKTVVIKVEDQDKFIGW
jgi:hypothetical protein